MNYGNIESKNVNDLIQVIYDSGELASAVTALAIVSIAGDTDLEYQLITRFIDDSIVGDYKLTFNNDTDANYGYQLLFGAGVTVTAPRDASETYLAIGRTENDDYHSFGIANIYAKSGSIRTSISKFDFNITGTNVSGGVKLFAQAWADTTNNITSMVITAESNNINSNSRIILNRKVSATDGTQYGNMNVKGIMKYAWQEVYKNTLASAVTATTISNLNGNSDILYKLSLRAINNSESASLYNVLFNNDSSVNYGQQYIRGSGAVASAFGDNAKAAFDLGYADGLNYISHSEYVFYVKSGFVRPALGSRAMGITGTTVTYQDLEGAVWADTSNNVTSMVITATQTAGLGVGTYICLERLNL